MSVTKTIPKHKAMTAVHIRWMIRRDLAEVLAIEHAGFEFPWSEDDFIRCLRQRNAIGMVAEHDERIVGYMLYELHKNRLRVLNFAVHRSFTRQGVGRAMVTKLQNKLTPQRRNEITLEVRESNLDAQLFWRACGFRAVSINREFYRDTDEAAYTMRYRCPVKAEPQP